MATGTPCIHPSTHAFRGFDQSVERAVGADIIDEPEDTEAGSDLT